MERNQLGKRKKKKKFEGILETLGAMGCGWGVSLCLERNSWARARNYNSSPN